MMATSTPHMRKYECRRLPPETSDVMDIIKATMSHPAKTVRGDGSERLIGK
jgi:hypothetical protein